MQGQPVYQNSMDGQVPQYPQQGQYQAPPQQPPQQYQQPYAAPPPAGQSGDWKEPLLLAPFRDVPLCLCSTFLPYFRMGLTVERARLGMSFVTAVVLLCVLHISITLFNGFAAEEGSTATGVLFDLLSIIAFAVMLFLMISWRERMRRQYGIDGNVCFDCLAVFFCSCCAVAQEATEADMRELGYLSSCTCEVTPDQERQHLNREVV